MVGNAELSKSSDSLHYRQSRQYEVRTPDGLPAAGVGAEAGSALAGERDGHGAKRDSKGKGRAIATGTEHDGEDDSFGVRSASPSGSSEEDDLLPTFEGHGSRGHGAYAVPASESAISLGLAQNGFTSREDLHAPGTNRSRSSSGSSQLRPFSQGDAQDRHLAPSPDMNDNEKAAGKQRKRTRASSGSKKKKRKNGTGKFAKEMAFVTVPSILLSMLGSVLAGEVLAQLKTWPVFLRVEELFILVPILLNLKGNLEMNLAARFSTSANIGELDLRQTRRSLILGNMALLQVQALLVSMLAGFVAFILGLMSRQGLAAPPSTLTGHDISIYGLERGGYFECLMVLCASMIAASASSAVVGAFMCSLVVVSRFLKINPDNLATPLAASLGDLLALTILGMVAKAGASFVGTFWSTVIFACLLCFIGMNVFFTLRNAYVQELIWAGWIPLLLALAVSSATGVVLQTYVNQYRGFGLIAPVVTGVAGNVGAIFVSRISTALHGAKEEKYLRTATTLFFITTPILIAFLAFVWVSGQAKIGLPFSFTYSSMSIVLMLASLWCAYKLTFWLWQRDFDPDINALPLLSSAVDLLGQLLLAGAYALAAAMGGDVILPTPIVTPDGVITGANATSVVVGEAVSEATARILLVLK